MKTVGKHGYVLWNWRQQLPSSTLVTETVATPTKKVLPPFLDSVKGKFLPG